MLSTSTFLLELVRSCVNLWATALSPVNYKLKSIQACRLMEPSLQGVLDLLAVSAGEGAMFTYLFVGYPFYNVFFY